MDASNEPTSDITCGTEDDLEGVLRSLSNDKNILSQKRRNNVTKKEVQLSVFVLRKRNVSQTAVNSYACTNQKINQLFKNQFKKNKGSSSNKYLTHNCFQGSLLSKQSNSGFKQYSGIL